MYKNIKTLIEKKFENVFLDLDNLEILENYTLIPIQIHSDVDSVSQLASFVCKKTECDLITINDANDEIKFFIKTNPNTHKYFMKYMFNSFYVFTNIFVLLFSSFFLFQKIL
jgi:hypothetical protein